MKRYYFILFILSLVINECMQIVRVTISGGTYLYNNMTTTAEWDDALLFEVAIDPFQQIAISGKEEGRQAGLRDGYNEGINIGRSKGWEIGLELGYMHDFSQGILDGYLKKSSCSGDSDDGVDPSHTKTKLQESAKQQTQHTTEHKTRSHRLERCLTLARDLVDMINKFPDPDILLSQDQAYDSMKSTIENDEVSPTENDCCTNNTDGQSTDDSCYNINEVGNKDDNVKILATPKEDSKQMAMLDISTSLERIRAKFKLLCVLLKTKQSFDLKTVLDLGDDDLSKEKSSTPNINIVNKSEDIKGNTRLESGSNKDISNLPIRDTTALESDW